MASSQPPPKDSKPGTAASIFYGYEIEYTKLFEDSVSMNFRVPIVGLLGAIPACVCVCMCMSSM